MEKNMHYENEYKEQIEEIYATIPEEYCPLFNKKANDALDQMARAMQEKIRDILEDIVNLDDEYLLGIFTAYNEIQECRNYINSHTK